ncbi:uncharacterized protein LY89DRAFT_209156 [Mollisia scopiformis]|uniref:Uncharacterized protein n=1 Tax=Mollisia scopiformis TaxID=149040 RepID=A0A194WXU4_MOLSC|nr:uncharacterized protein LY89DRAFT_209156 [Mollisia scopiformis]KUJ12504.1 hypothetical protein LY89DRAFT_209156 [Mollisia scopiformis]
MLSLAYSGSFVCSRLLNHPPSFKFHSHGRSLLRSISLSTTRREYHRLLQLSRASFQASLARPSSVFRPITPLRRSNAFSTTSRRAEEGNKEDYKRVASSANSGSDNIIPFVGLLLLILGGVAGYAMGSNGTGSPAAPPSQNMTQRPMLKCWKEHCRQHQQAERHRQFLALYKSYPYTELDVQVATVMEPVLMNEMRSKVQETSVRIRETLEAARRRNEAPVEMSKSQPKSQS